MRMCNALNGVKIMKKAVSTITFISLTYFGTALCLEAKPKAPPKPKVPASVMLENSRSSELTNFSVYATGQEEQALSSLKKPLISGKKIQLSLKGLKSCVVTLSGTFADGSDASGEVDVCAEKLIRLID